jgi:Putative papain-like cysteine peptidase (DUF1796)
MDTAVFISIGPCCFTTEYIKSSVLRTNSYPFDWIFSSIEMVNHCTIDKFKTFLDLSYNYSNCNHSFYDEK